VLQQSFTTCVCVCKGITLVGSNQSNSFENATACSKYLLQVLHTTLVSKFTFLASKCTFLTLKQTFVGLQHMFLTSKQTFLTSKQMFLPQNVHFDLKTYVFDLKCSLSFEINFVIFLQNLWEIFAKIKIWFWHNIFRIYRKYGIKCV